MKSSCKVNLFIVLWKSTKEEREMKNENFFWWKIYRKRKINRGRDSVSDKIRILQKNKRRPIYQKENARFGIAVVKTEYIPNNTKIENKEITYLSNDEQEVEKILRLFKENEVTPISVEDVLADLSKELF